MTNYIVHVINQHTGKQRPKNDPDGTRESTSKDRECY